MTHWFLSPHADDAVLSCGGQIAMLTARDERAVIVTVMAGDPDPALTPGLFVEELWARWGLGRDSAVTEARRAEDRAAAAVLGAEVELWPWPEAVYRTDTSLLYSDVNAIFGFIRPNDSALREIMDGQRIHQFSRRVAADDTVHVPLGVGNHVDHQLVRILSRMAFASRPDVYVIYYEEYPYSVRKRDAIAKTLAQFDTPETRYTAIPVTHPIDNDALDKKIAAIACYQSQIGTFWDNIESMTREVRHYTHQVGGEREQWLVLPEEYLKNNDRTTKS